MHSLKYISYKVLIYLTFWNFFLCVLHILNYNTAWRACVEYSLTIPQYSYEHFCRSAVGPLQQADMPQTISLKSMCPSMFSSNALYRLSMSCRDIGGQTSRLNSSKSNLPDADVFFRVLYCCSRYITSFSSTTNRQRGSEAGDGEQLMQWREDRSGDKRSLSDKWDC